MNTDNVQVWIVAKRRKQSAVGWFLESMQKTYGDWKPLVKRNISNKSIVNSVMPACYHCLKEQ